MIVLPAIDIKGGQCVRLYQGDFASAHKVAEDAVETARRFAAAGATWLHMVDLDGAKAGEPVNRDLIASVASGSGLQVELGGGIRTLQTIEEYLQIGIARVILGSIAVRDPDFVAEAVRQYGGERIVVGIDARAGRVATDGWLSATDADYIEMAKRMEQTGVQYIIFTDIARDGTLTGPNVEQLTALQESVSCHIIASGGIANLADIKALRALQLYGAICGKSIYQGTLDLSEALAAAV